MLLQLCLITSQNVTAPKPRGSGRKPRQGLITSQNVTAPKHRWPAGSSGRRLITSQNVTAPKLDHFVLLVLVV